MRDFLNKTFGCVAAVAFVFWCAAHVLSFGLVKIDASTFPLVWLGIVLFLVPVAFLEFGFRLDDGNRPGVAGHQIFRALPTPLRIVSVTFSIYVLALFIALLLDASAADYQTLQPYAAHVRAMFQSLKFDGSEPDVGQALAALAGTALVANISFNLASYLLFAEHQRRAPTWIDAALSLLLPCAFLINAGAYIVVGDWLMAAGSLVVAWWFLPRCSK